MREWVRLPLWTSALERFDRLVDPDLETVPELLHTVPLAVWGAALLAPEVYFPRAHPFLPVMPSDAVQTSWTGASGVTLLEQSVGFVSQLAAATAGAGLDLRSARVLDFGVGWGRLARLLLKYVAPRRFVGVDSWQSSLDLAVECRIPGTLALSDTMLDPLPFPEGSFDVAYAFSVFTHLSPEAFDACLLGLTRMLAPGGLVVFTIRPSRFWELRSDVPDVGARVSSQALQFEAMGHTHFGDTTLGIEELQRRLHRAGLQLRTLEWLPVDAMQVIVIAGKS